MSTSRVIGGLSNLQLSPSCHCLKTSVHSLGPAHPEVLGVIPQVLETLGHSLTIFFPLPLAEHNLQEVPHPANQGHKC